VATFDWFPMDITAWDRDTAHLSCLEDGAYWRLVRHYMRTRLPIPNDDRALANIARVSIEEWLEMAFTIRQFFINSSDAQAPLRHKRCEAEIKEQNRRAERLKKAGQKGGRRSAALKKTRANSPHKLQTLTSHASAPLQPSSSEPQATVQQPSSHAQAQSNDFAAQDKDILSSTKDGLSYTLPRDPTVHTMNDVPADGPGNGSGKAIEDRDRDRTRPPTEIPMPGLEKALADGPADTPQYRLDTCLSVFDLMDETFGPSTRTGTLVKDAVNYYVAGGFSRDVILDGCQEVLAAWNRLPVFDEEAWLMKALNNWMVESGHVGGDSQQQGETETEAEIRARVAAEYGHEKSR
jgi:uncharacterized protein YdaU (DUF1376 family)